MIYAFRRGKVRAKRRSLADLVAGEEPAAASPETASPALAEPKNPSIPTPPPAVSGRAKYPSATVYLPPRALRLIKQISLEENRRISDLIAEALDEYLQKRGHKSLGE